MTPRARIFWATFKLMDGGINGCRPVALILPYRRARKVPYRMERRTKIEGVITGLVAKNCVTCHSGAHGAALTSVDFTDANSVLHTAADATAFLEGRGRWLQPGTRSL